MLETLLSDKKQVLHIIASQRIPVSNGGEWKAKTARGRLIRSNQCNRRFLVLYQSKHTGWHDRTHKCNARPRHTQALAEQNLQAIIKRSSASCKPSPLVLREH